MEDAAEYRQTASCCLFSAGCSKYVFAPNLNVVSIGCFVADPLRVLRAVRFGTRFGFELETSILEAAASDQVSWGGATMGCFDGWENGWALWE